MFCRIPYSQNMTDKMCNQIATQHIIKFINTTHVLQNMHDAINYV